MSTDDSFRELCCEGGKKSGASGRHTQSGKAPSILAGPRVRVVHSCGPGGAARPQESFSPLFWDVLGLRASLGQKPLFAPLPLGVPLSEHTACHAVPAHAHLLSGAHTGPGLSAELGGALSCSLASARGKSWEPTEVIDRDVGMGSNSWGLDRNENE